MAYVGCHKTYCITLFLLVKKKENNTTHLPPQRMDLRQNTASPVNTSECKFSWAALYVKRKPRNPNSLRTAKSTLSLALVRVMFWGKQCPKLCYSSSPLQGTGDSSCSPTAPGRAAASKSQCPQCTLSQVLGTLAGTAVLGKQIFDHFNKALSLLIHLSTFSSRLCGCKNISALLLQPHLSIICFYNKPRHSFCFFFYKPSLYATVWSTHFLFLHVFGVGFVLLPELD